MISNADVIERLGTLLQKELSSEALHEVLFCEGKHKKVLQRFYLGKQSYVQYKVIDSSAKLFVDISILGNPNTFRMGIEEINGQHIFQSEPRVSYSYL
ncbi:hypothetical protein LS684_04905 [Cytobacillus spongiae]|jgi:hypothetical protein|uniref:hypothetical protein n=1 Tax=Cytobacillus spongiae TaxID=2901381 RepID=UPI001F2C3BEA|nr:hypothetical protein [Cytobacillus spongiae]UII56808.1 hypothetical protein LS684_04905 [Cytobacillus spongiae]